MRSFHPLRNENWAKKYNRKKIKLKEVYKFQIKVGIHVNFKYIELILSGLIQ